MLICVGVGLGVVLVVCCIHVCSLFHEKFANVQVTFFRRRMQRCGSTENTRIKTSQTKQKFTSKCWHAYAQCWVSYSSFVAFTSAPFSTRNSQTSKWPPAEDQCSGVLPLQVPESKRRKQNKSSRVKVDMRMCRAGCRTNYLLHSRLLRFLRGTGKRPRDLLEKTNAAVWFHWEYQNQNVANKTKVHV